MDADVVDLTSRRTPAPTSDANMTCSCGSGWWTLRGSADTPGPDHGAVVVARDGRITGYAGEFRCLECGQPGTPASLSDSAF
jgi:predicted RNA-binding Zn-ribbon protein involved in translation (DUF1610 family)